MSRRSLLTIGSCLLTAAPRELEAPDDPTITTLVAAGIQPESGITDKDLR